MDASLRSILLLAGSVAIAASCHAVFGLTDYEVGTATGVGTATPTGGTGGGTSGCDAPQDCPGQDTTCSYRTCESQLCGTATAPRGTPCNEDGGRFCDDSGSCVECNTPSECSDGEDCVQNQCVALTCANDTQDGDETDVDCGGSCPPCANGLGCIVYQDCASRFCDTGGGSGGGGVGGASGQPVCAACGDDADCAPATDTWCDLSTDGGSCQDQLDDGQTCAQDAECLSGYCPAGSSVCCNAACDGYCESCLGADTGGADGTCATTSLCGDCDAQYGSSTEVFEVCGATQSECVLRVDADPIPCRDTCWAMGGECLSAVNDEPNGSCGASATTLSCTINTYTSLLCTCSSGCGSGPPCVAPDICTGGTCG
jgi:hypothetical protein